ncbi:MAG: universal stress protein [Planctomycetota bacterium]
MTWFQQKKVLVPIDFSEKSDAAVDTVLALGMPPKRISVINVAPDLAMMTPGVVWEELTDDSRRANIDRKFHEVFRGPEYEGISLHVAFGDPGHEIAAHAEEIDADLIVMPSHGRTGLTRLMLGSVAERVLRLSHCAVLILRD